MRFDAIHTNTVDLGKGNKLVLKTPGQRSNKTRSLGSGDIMYKYENTRMRNAQCLFEQRKGQEQGNL